MLREAKVRPYLPIVERFIETCINPDEQMVQHQKAIAQLILGHEDIKKPDELRDLFESLWHKNEMKPFIQKPNYIAEGSLGEIIETISKRVNSYPRKTPGRVKIDGMSFTFADLHSFYYQVIQIFKSDLYGFKADNDNPVILDCGAHIGLASMYFAAKYPKGKIYAYEADPAIAKMLEENIKSLELKNVKTFAKAIWINDDGVLFENTNDDSGYISHFENGNCVRIPSIRIKNFIEDQKVDLLKLDIEGSEYEVIADCDDVLANVKTMIIEVHKFRDQNGSLGSIFSVLEKNNSEYTLGDLHSADWLGTQIKPPFDAIKSDKYIISVFAWQKTERQVTYKNKFELTVDSQNELFERCIEYMNKNDNDNAFKLINYAIEKYSDIPALNYGKAIVSARIGQKQEAMEALKKLLENQPDHKNAQILFEALNQECEK